MQIAICSIFRDSTAYLDRYFSSIYALGKFLPQYSIRLVLAEGDSQDDTWQQLRIKSAGFNATLLQVHHGGPDYGSINRDERWRQSSRVWSEVWGSLKPDDDMVVYVESDLIWGAVTMSGLIHLTLATCAIAPMVWHGTIGGPFYDTWGFRRNGACFSPDPPFHPDLGTKLLEIDSAGSCIVMSGEAARAAKFEPPELAVVGLCQSMRAAGYRLWVDPLSSIVHPL